MTSHFAAHPRTTFIELGTVSPLSRQQQFWRTTANVAMPFPTLRSTFGSSRSLQVVFAELAPYGGLWCVCGVIQGANFATASQAGELVYRVGMFQVSMLPDSLKEAFLKVPANWLRSG